MRQSVTASMKTLKKRSQKRHLREKRRLRRLREKKRKKRTISVQVKGITNLQNHNKLERNKPRKIRNKM